MISDRKKSIYRWIVILWSRKKKLSDSLLSSNFESIDRYYRGTDVLNQLSKLIKKWKKKKVDIKSKLRRIGCPLVVLLLSAEKAYPLKFFFYCSWLLTTGRSSFNLLAWPEVMKLRRVGLSGFFRSICLCLLSVWSFSSFTDK